jgi:hypothetical protein
MQRKEYSVEEIKQKKRKKAVLNEKIGALDLQGRMLGGNVLQGDVNFCQS